MDINSEKDWDLKLNNLKTKAEAVEIIPAKEALMQSKKNGILNDREAACSYYRAVLYTKLILVEAIKDAIRKGKSEVQIGDKDVEFNFPSLKNTSSAQRRLCAQVFSRNLDLVNEISKWLSDSGYKVDIYHKEDPDSPRTFDLYAFKIRWGNNS